MSLLIEEDIKRIAQEAAREIILSGTAVGVRNDEAKDIASAIMKHLHEGGVCPNGMDKETVNTLKDVLPDMVEFSKVYRSAKTNINRAIFALIGVGAAGLFCAGIWEKMKPIFQAMSAKP